ncbi:GGDEF domain-containing protein [Paenibacillus sp. S150]|uniref:GGDEF domain-containing protein n=1 Tax=Paenibacillus sp. S150 TaxID=2749826 RepID=UPI001C5633FA|nr:GGDEF domain-containing protein [Paenibacillus sp. S150]MBW4084726.1 GGDEF domain-containing protein [Paenibacillus sp. S150]
MIAVHLDLKTLLVCLFFGNFFTVLLVIAYRSRYPKDGTSGLFVLAKLLQLALLLLFMNEGNLGLRVTLPLNVLLAVGAGTAEAFSLLKLLGAYSGRVRTYYFLLAGLSAVCLLSIYLLFPDKPLHIASAALAGVLFLIYPAYILGMKFKITPLQELMGFLYGIVILTMLGRAALIFYTPVTGGSSAPAFLQILYYTGIYLLMFLGTAGFMLLSREQSYAELERAATYDELTGILNRGAFVQRARSMIAASSKEKIPFSFLLVDIDHFKNVNDTYGHDTGDRVLRDFAGKIEGQLGNGDLFGRFGGEEFAVLLHRSDEEASGVTAEQLRLSVLDAIIDGVPMPYTVSIGVITIPSGERVPLNTLYRLSDAALYQAKQQGRNRVVRSRETGGKA